MMEFRHVHFCTDDYHLILNGFSSCTFLYVWLPFLFDLIFVMHIRCKWLSTFFLNGLLSCTFLCEWLPFLFEWIVVMHVSVRMISFLMDCCHARFCANDCHFVVYGFSSCTFLCEWLSIYYWFFHMCNALQRGNSTVEWRIINDIIIYLRFWPCA